MSLAQFEEVKLKHLNIDDLVATPVKLSEKSNKEIGAIKLNLEAQEKVTSSKLEEYNELTVKLNKKLDAKSNDVYSAEEDLKTAQKNFESLEQQIAKVKKDISDAESEADRHDGLAESHENERQRNRNNSRMWVASGNEMDAANSKKEAEICREKAEGLRPSLRKLENSLKKEEIFVSKNLEVYQEKLDEYNKLYNKLEDKLVGPRKELNFEVNKFEKLLSSSKEELAGIFYQEGNTNQSQNKHIDAIKLYSKAIELARHKKYYVARGDSHLALGNYKDAFVDFKKGENKDKRKEVANIIIKANEASAQSKLDTELEIYERIFKEWTNGKVNSKALDIANNQKKRLVTAKTRLQNSFDVNDDGEFCYKDDATQCLGLICRAQEFMYTHILNRRIINRRQDKNSLEDLKSDIRNIAEKHNSNIGEIKSDRNDGISKIIGNHDLSKDDLLNKKRENIFSRELRFIVSQFTAIPAFLQKTEKAMNELR